MAPQRPSGNMAYCRSGGLHGASGGKSGEAANEASRQVLTNLRVRRNGQVSFFLCLPELRRDHSALAGKMRIVRRVEYDHRGSRRARVGGAAVRRGAAGRPFPLEDLSGATQSEPRLVTGVAELDRVAGGGFVAGSATLIGGEPGIGKSTLLIQACAAVARSGGRVVYVSGEESTAQVRLRAARLGLAEAPVQLAAQTFVEDIVATLGSGDAPKFVVIDSIQTMWSDAIESAPGTVSQVRGSAQALIRFAKASGAALLLVGHVTKDGQIAGPRVVEHMVDAVFSFEGDGAHAFRLLRAAKNRFGATDEVGVFEMTGGGLAEVPNPSALFLAERDGAANPAPRSSPASKGRGRFWSRSRLWSRRRRSARRAAPLSAGSRADSPWCSRFSRPTGA